jgi:hypothetical protein
MDNLFLQAIGNDEVERINKIKKNKEFLKRLINDLQQVYTLEVSNQDQQNSTKYYIKKYGNSIPSIFFKANENGITFSTDLLGYRKCSTPSWELGWLTEKYDTCKGDRSFMNENPLLSTHGNVKVEIEFTDVSANLMDIIRDIARILDFKKVSKKF